MHTTRAARMVLMHIQLSRMLSCKYVHDKHVKHTTTQTYVCTYARIHPFEHTQARARTYTHTRVRPQLERWKETFESQGLRVSGGGGQGTCHAQKKYKTIYIQGKEVNTVKRFKYLGSLFDANGGSERDVNNRVTIAWSKWRETTA